MIVGVQSSSVNSAPNSGKKPPSDNTIQRLCAQFEKTVCVFIPELKVRIRTPIETITADTRNELDYFVGVCRITNIDHLLGM